MRNRRNAAWLIIVGVGAGLLPAWSGAQSTGAGETPALRVVDPAAEQVDDKAAVAGEPDDVMAPTRHGFRLTPDLVRMGARRWLQVEIGQDVTLDEQQEEALSEKVARRVMAMTHGHSEDFRDLVEMAMESFIANRGRNMAPDTSRKFAERASNLVPLAREFFKDFARDARPLLTDDQWEQLKDRLRKDFRRVDRIGKIVDRWASGHVEEGDDLFRELGSADREELQDADGAKPARMTLDLRRARRRAEDDLRRLAATHWAAFVKETAAFFKFSDEQIAKANDVLTRYRGQAEALMTPDWLERGRANRVKYHLRWSLGRDSVAPWTYHLEREFNDLVASVNEIEQQFRHEVVALATNEQRDAAAAQIRERAAKYGMSLDDIDEDLLRLGRGE